jgi:predicted Fe-S protein YdhL (DUF1289 family)
VSAKDAAAVTASNGGIPVSPCIGICQLDPATRICRGCLRTVEEIAAWYRTDFAGKRAILARLAARRAARSVLPGDR